MSNCKNCGKNSCGCKTVANVYTPGRPVCITEDAYLTERDGLEKKCLIPGIPYYIKDKSEEGDGEATCEGWYIPSDPCQGSLKDLVLRAKNFDPDCFKWNKSKCIYEIDFGRLAKKSRTVTSIDGSTDEALFLRRDGDNCEVVRYEIKFLPTASAWIEENQPYDEVTIDLSGYSNPECDAEGITGYWYRIRDKEGSTVKTEAVDLARRDRSFSREFNVELPEPINNPYTIQYTVTDSCGTSGIFEQVFRVSDLTKCEEALASANGAMNLNYYSNRRYGTGYDTSAALNFVRNSWGITGAAPRNSSHIMFYRAGFERLFAGTGRAKSVIMTPSLQAINQGSFGIDATNQENATDFKITSNLNQFEAWIFNGYIVAPCDADYPATIRFRMDSTNKINEQYVAVWKGERTGGLSTADTTAFYQRSDTGRPPEIVETTDTIQIEKGDKVQITYISIDAEGGVTDLSLQIQINGGAWQDVTSRTQIEAAGLEISSLY